MINAKKRFINNIIRVGIFVLFGILFLSGNTFASTLTQNCYCDNPSNCNNTKFACIDYDIGEYVNIGDYTNTLTGGVNFLGTNPLVFSKYTHFAGSNTYDIYTYTFYQLDGYITTLQLNYYNSNKGDTYIYTGTMPCLVEDTTDNQNFYRCGFTYNRRAFTGTIEQANELIGDSNLIGWRILPNGNSESSTWLSNIRVCGMYDNNTAICIPSLGAYQYAWATNCNNSNLSVCSYTGTIRSKVSPGYATSDISYEMLLTDYNLSSSLFTTPSSGGGGESGGGTLIPLDSDVDMVINYYEQRGYSESMCYVGTDNLTATFGTSGVSFEEGSGESIFGLYNSIYDGFGNNIIQNVGKFVNVRDINYGQWFYCDGENCPRWLAELTGNDVNINLNYTGLTFPFANKPVAIYFMASNLSETYNIDTHGFDVAFYCYSKLNRDSIADGSIDYSDIKEKAGSGVIDKIDTYNQYLIDYYTPKGTFQVPTSGEFRDSFLSGEDYSGVNNIDMSETFSNYFTRITNIFQNYSPQYSTGIIPVWIIFPLIFLILFRIMKH